MTPVSDDDLIRDLVDLGRRLDHPPGAGLAAAVGDRLRAEAQAGAGDGGAGRPARRRRSARRPLVLAAAAVVALLIGVVVAVAPAREAVARWFGIGAVALRPAPPEELPPGANPVPGLGGSNAQASPVDPARLQAAAGFPLRFPADPAAGGPVAAEVDERVPGGLVAVTYPTFTLVQTASPPGDGPTLAKLLPFDARLAPTRVAGTPGWWITGPPHDLAYLDRDGQVRHDTVRRAGAVLLWAAGGVTYRIEGLPDPDAAVRIAESLR